MAHITKKAEGKYLIRISKGTGRARHFTNQTFRGTRKEAKAHARKLESIIDSGQAIQATYTFEKYFADWLKAVKRSIQPRTYDGYREYIDRYAIKALGQKRLGKITGADVKQVYDSLELAPTTIRNLHAALRACFGYAVKQEHLHTNPCRNVPLPKKTGWNKPVLTLEEARRFAKVCREMPNGIIFEFALQTGMRPEEYLALRWHDIADCDVHVMQAVQHNRKGGGYYFKEVKTKQARRRIPIDPDLRKLLTVHRREQNEHRLAMKGTWFNHDLVFANEIGRPFQLTNVIRRYYKPILEKCEFEKNLTLYSLRHSCATILLMMGENPKVVAERLGHASITMTLDTYSHVLPGIQESATEKISRALRA